MFFYLKYIPICNKLNKTKVSNMKKYIALDEIGLNETTGALGKIRRLLIEDVPCKKVYKEVQKDIQYKNHNTKQAAYWAGYSKTITINVFDKYLYKKELLLEWFDTNKTISFKRKEVDVSEYYDYKIIQNIDT